MCLGIPGKVVELSDDRGMVMGVIDFGGATRRVCLAYTPDARVGDYVIVHAGFAISILDESAAQESLELFEQLGFVEGAEETVAEATSEGTRS